jgi:hypothetical protein
MPPMKVRIRSIRSISVSGRLYARLVAHVGRGNIAAFVGATIDERMDSLGQPIPDKVRPVVPRRITSESIISQNITFSSRGRDES